MIRRGTLVRLCLVVLAVVAVSLLLREVVHVSLDDIQRRVDAAGVYAPIAYGALLFLGLTVPFNPISDLATVNVAALVFAPEVSVLATWCAHTLAISVNYLVARRYGHYVVRLIAGNDEVARHGWLSRRVDLRTVFVMRFFLPLTAIGIDFVSYAAGLKKLRFWQYYVASIVPWTLLSVVYFTATSLLRERSLAWFFLPAAVLILAPGTVVLVRRAVATRVARG